MLDWLKPILGEGYTEELDKQVSEEIGKLFVARSDFNTLNQAKKDLEETVRKYDGKDPEKLSGDLAALQKKYDDDLAAANLENALNVALMGAKARDVKAVKPFLDTSLLKLDGTKVLGLDEQLKGLKESRDFLFEPEQTAKPPRTGMSHQGGGEGSPDKKEEANAAIRAVFGKEI